VRRESERKGDCAARLEAGSPDLSSNARPRCGQRAPQLVPMRSSSFGIGGWHGASHAHDSPCYQNDLHPLTIIGWRTATTGFEIKVDSDCPRGPKCARARAASVGPTHCRNRLGRQPHALPGHGLEAPTQPRGALRSPAGPSTRPSRRREIAPGCFDRAEIALEPIRDHGTGFFQISSFGSKGARRFDHTIGLLQRIS